MDFKRDELVGIFVSIVIATAIFAVLRFDMFTKLQTYMATPSEVETVEIDASDDQSALKELLTGSFTKNGKITKLIIQDSKVGDGAVVHEGSRVTVHYIGKLQDGTKFDSSYDRNEPYVFTVGEGSVIKGWDTGLLGMKVGGERILVIPDNLAYGNREVGTIPPRSTLLFAIELIKSE